MRQPEMPIMLCCLGAGVVLTIEPGLYIPDDEAYGSLRGIGVRIEDDVAVTGKCRGRLLSSEHGIFQGG